MGTGQDARSGRWGRPGHSRPRLASQPRVAAPRLPPRASGGRYRGTRSEGALLIAKAGSELVEEAKEEKKEGGEGGGGQGRAEPRFAAGASEPQEFSPPEAGQPRSDARLPLARPHGFTGRPSPRR